MKLSLSLLALVASASAGLFNSKDVRILTGKDFKRLVTASDKLTLAAFVAPWCGYCKQLAPEFDKAATNLKGLVNLVAVDCDEDGNKQLCQDQGVKGFPTIKIFPGGKAPPSSYDGERTGKGMVNYVLGRMPSFVKKVASATNLESLREKATQKPIALLFTTAKAVTPMYKSLSSSFHKSIDFYAAKESTVGIEAMNKFGISKSPALVVLRGDEVTVYEGELKLEAIHAFLKPIAEAAKSATKKATGEL